MFPSSINNKREQRHTGGGGRFTQIFKKTKIEHTSHMHVPVDEGPLSETSASTGFHTSDCQ